MATAEQQIAKLIKSHATYCGRFSYMGEWCSKKGHRMWYEHGIRSESLSEKQAKTRIATHLKKTTNAILALKGTTC
jgi:hypothetical protein